MERSHFVTKLKSDIWPFLRRKRKTILSRTANCEETKKTFEKLLFSICDL